MGDIVWSVSPDHDGAGDLTIHMRDFASQVFTAYGMEYELHIDERADLVVPDQESRKNIFLVFKEAIHNSLRHAKASKIVVTVTAVAGEFVMTVQDNGCGFDFNASSHGVHKTDASHEVVRGHGLRSMTKRAHDIRAEIFIVGSVGSGTKVTLRKKMT
jgi:signal transduction histidine kinase